MSASNIQRHASAPAKIKRPSRFNQIWKPFRSKNKTHCLAPEDISLPYALRQDRSHTSSKQHPQFPFYDGDRDGRTKTGAKSSTALPQYLPATDHQPAFQFGAEVCYSESATSPQSPTENSHLEQAARLSRRSTAFEPHYQQNRDLSTVGNVGLDDCYNQQDAHASHQKPVHVGEVFPHLQHCAACAKHLTNNEKLKKEKNDHKLEIERLKKALSEEKKKLTDANELAAAEIEKFKNERDAAQTLAQRNEEKLKQKIDDESKLIEENKRLEEKWIAAQFSTHQLRTSAQNASLIDTTESLVGDLEDSMNEVRLNASARPHSLLLNESTPRSAQTPKSINGQRNRRTSPRSVRTTNSRSASTTPDSGAVMLPLGESPSLCKSAEQMQQYIFSCKKSALATLEIAQSCCVKPLPPVIGSVYNLDDYIVMLKSCEQLHLDDFEKFLEESNNQLRFIIDHFFDLKRVVNQIAKNMPPQVATTSSREEAEVTDDV